MLLTVRIFQLSQEERSFFRQAGAPSRQVGDLCSASDPFKKGARTAAAPSVELAPGAPHARHLMYPILLLISRKLLCLPDTFQCRHIKFPQNQITFSKKHVEVFIKFSIAGHPPLPLKV